MLHVTWRRCRCMSKKPTFSSLSIMSKSQKRANVYASFSCVQELTTQQRHPMTRVSTCPDSFRHVPRLQGVQRMMRTRQHPPLNLNQTMIKFPASRNFVERKVCVFTPLTSHGRCRYFIHARQCKIKTFLAFLGRCVYFTFLQQGT